MFNPFAAVGQVIGKVFGTDKAAESLITNISSGLDKLHYGDQEKAEHRVRLIERGQDVLLNWLESTKGQNLARRILALSVTFTWLALFWFMVVARFAAIWVERAEEQLQESALLFKETGLAIQDAVWLILLFYFAAPHMGQVIETLFNRILKKK